MTSRSDMAFGAPENCPVCGEDVGAGCDEPCVQVTYARGPTDPPAIGPIYHVRCWGREDLTPDAEEDPETRRSDQ